jgi:hypothetical protein
MRRALIVANDTYDHEGLRHLLAPGADAAALAEVLGDEGIGDFDVKVVRNEPAYVIQEEIEDLFADSRPEDVLLLHFSCHGLKGESGELFFATRNTRPNRLGSTAVSADFVQRCMRGSRSRSIVLLLDCCYGGAFSRGVTVRAAGDVNVRDSFPPGRGRAVITASSAMEYAFEGDQLADDQSVRPSVFTSALVEGLATGEADRDQDGWVSLNELYDYVFDRVRERNPHQTPSKDVEMQGELYLARRGRPVSRPAPLPPELQAVIDHPIVNVREGAVRELARLAHGRHAGMALAAREALERLSHDDSRTVAAAAEAALNDDALEPGPDDTRDDGPTAATSGLPTAVDPAASGPPAAMAPDGPGRAKAARTAVASAAPRRRWWWLSAAAVAVVLAVAAVLLFVDRGDSGDAIASEGPLPADNFEAEAPWRLQIRDNIQGKDVGCTVSMVHNDSGLSIPLPTGIYSPMSFQMQRGGTFNWSASDPGCLASLRSGAGSAKLPFVPELFGDTDAFGVTGPVSIEVIDFRGNAECRFALHDAADGGQLDFGSIPKSGGTLTLNPGNRSTVYLTNEYCVARISAA